MTPAPLILRNLETSSNTGFNILYGAFRAFEYFGNTAFNRQFTMVTDAPGFPDLRRRITNFALDIDGYHADLQRYYDANPEKDIFSLEVIPIPINTQKGQVYASSWKHIDLQTGKLVTPNKYSVLISTIPLFQNEEPAETTHARACLLGLHELGHIAKDFSAGENGHCHDQQCIMSKPENAQKRQAALEEKVERYLSTKMVPFCKDCKKGINDFSIRYAPA